MKIRFLSLLIFGLILAGTDQAHAVVRPKAAETSTVEAGPAGKKDLKNDKRMKRFRDRMEKLEKKFKKKKAAPSVWDDSRFRLGAILTGGAIILAIIAGAVSSGFLGVLATLLALAGLVFLIWSLIEYYG